MSTIKIESNSSGAALFTIASPNSNTNRTLTLPDATGTVVVTGGAQTIEFAAGSASTPSITTTGDTNTGIFFPAADTIAFTEGGAEVARFDSDGDFGIGTTSPSNKLDVIGAIAGKVSSTATTLSSAPSLKVINTATATTNQLAEIQFRYEDGTYNGNGAIAALRESGTARGQAFVFAPSNSSGDPTERARITSIGDFRLGTTSQIGSGWLSMRYDGGTYNGLTIQSSTAGTYYAALFYPSTGSFVGSISVAASSTAYNTSSDYRLKENIAPMTNGLEKILQLNPVTYTWKADGSAGEGFIAHELQEVCSQAVTGEKDAVDVDGNPKYQGVDTSFLVATLTAAIQELNAKVQTLEAQNATFEARLATLEAN